MLGSDKDPEALILRLKEEEADIPAIYMACGTDDFLLDVNRRYHHFLQTEKITHTYIESIGAHAWDFWNETVVEVLE